MFLKRKLNVFNTSLRLCLCLCLPALLCSPGLAQSPPAYTPQQTNAQNPSLIDDIDIGLGYLSALSSGGSSGFYYHLAYKGSLLTQRGTPFTPADVNAPLDLKAPDPVKTDGDFDLFALRFERGGAGIQNGFLEGLGLIPVKFSSRSRFLRETRGVLQVSSRFDGKQSNIAGGLETPPLHPLRLIGNSYGTTNWLTFGGLVEGQSRRASEGGNQAVPMITYRAFLGKGFGWVQGKSLVDEMYAAIIKQAPTYEALLQQIPQIKQRIVTSGQLPTLQESVLIQLSGVAPWQTQKPSQEDYQKKVKEFLGDFSKSYTTRPGFAAWLESSAWYALSHDSGTSARFNNILAATLTYWINPRDDSPYWLRVRYESGRERAAPTVNLNQILFFIGRNF